MKHVHLQAFVVMLLGACGAAAMAQSTAKAWGRIDVGIVSLDNGQSRLTDIDSGEFLVSRVGFKGSEDLGGGNAAHFYLETGFLPDTGSAIAGSRIWNRGAYVGLSSKDWGRLQIGRMFVPIFYVFNGSDEGGAQRTAAYGTVSALQRTHLFRINAAALGQAVSASVSSNALVSASGGTASANFTSAFANNQAQYMSPSFAGLSFMLSAAPGENNADGGKLRGANVQYQQQGVYLGAAWNRIEGASLGGAPQRTTEAAIDANYTVLSSVEFWANVHRWSVNTGLAEVSGHGYALGAIYTGGPHSLWADYGRKALSACAACGSSAWSVGYYYALSRRTQLYSFYAKVTNQANAATVLGSNNTPPSSYGAGVRGIGAGVVHVF